MEEQFNPSDFKAWGQLAVINLYECDNELIQNPEVIKKFIIQLCDKIRMVRVGEPLIKKFAEGLMEGYSAMQFIETSSITMHFDDKINNRAFIDIFSCKYFDAEMACEFSKNYFMSNRSEMKVIVRD